MKDKEEVYIIFIKFHNDQISSDTNYFFEICNEILVKVKDE